MHSSQTPQLSPNYSVVFEFEQKHDPKAAQLWFSKNWHISLYLSAFYLMLVFSGKEYMKNRRAFKLRKLLVAWNVLLALFSVFGACRTLPEMYHVLKHHGFDHSVCNPSYAEHVKGFWTWMFTLSKIPELGDTLFIILRKQSLILLHWYHHVTVFLFCWYSYPEHFSTARWSVCMNYTVHSIMYTYYAIRALGYRPPRLSAMLITLMQTLQMVVGLFVNCYAFYQKMRGNYCHCQVKTLIWALIMYGSYLALFSHYFYTVYFKRDTKKTQ
ncbi:elongation of very long chain fatty acids protein 6-like protein [Dinothrombium tinctorium]|uniref:Elongation of very long chain fatty acids protein n=1 Tax=Dinothrombium tinctorium TaxID=1965070 RepID=A0A3S3S5U3_9ACAR|nr:elongation of very long chain fatty acids protein 6-like protein [Dinothrombium tinctorium]RWS10799.1 elongation of very long chain fatty acids protein 6-like protein [Dinothrombium tinctorium]RWS10805.1 elongation of very long chain fatty acids protein 6-like protein [Dinothrombium tinctorium]